MRKGKRHTEKMESSINKGLFEVYFIDDSGMGTAILTTSCTL